MFTKRYGCVVFMIVVTVAVTITLYRTRYEAKDRGLRLENLRAGEFTFDAWSYGNWETSHEGTLTIETFAPPYTLLLAISTDDSDASTIEILQAELVDSDGGRTSVLSKLSDRIDKVQVRPWAVIRRPYAVFCFNDLLASHATVTLEVEFQVVRNGSTAKAKQRLSIPGYEKIKRSFTFVEALMSV